jgi:hypothetical protein
VANGRFMAHMSGMAVDPSIRLLEVSVESVEPTLWKWRIRDRNLEVAHGYETSRETAQIRGDGALFRLLSKGF